MLTTVSVTDIIGLSATDNRQGGLVARTEADLRIRLQRAALELFGERGYDRTTAAEIAAKTGVTERTFFRYFADKREVLFDGEIVLGTAPHGLDSPRTDRPGTARTPVPRLPVGGAAHRRQPSVLRAAAGT